jgi:hypothetical protein
MMDAPDLVGRAFVVGVSRRTTGAGG